MLFLACHRMFITFIVFRRITLSKHRAISFHKNHDNKTSWMCVTFFIRLHCSDSHLDYFITANLHLCKSACGPVGTFICSWTLKALTDFLSLSLPPCLYLACVRFVCNIWLSIIINCSVCNLYLNCDGVWRLRYRSHCVI